MESEKKRRRVLRSFLTKKISEIETALKSKAENELPILIEQLEQLNVQVESSNAKVQQFLLDEIDDDDESNDKLEEELVTAQSYKENYIAASVRLKQKLVSTAVIKRDYSSASSSSNPICVKLPTLNLPFFNGNILEWQPFMDSFSAAVGSRDITDVEKFNYLRNQLKGDAAKSIQGMALTSANYGEAIEILQKRYGRPSSIIRAHVKNLLALEKVSRSSPQTLRKLVDEIEINVRGLKTLGVTSDSYSIFLNQIVLSKLPSSLCLDWARKEDSDEADIEELIKFLDKEIQSQEVIYESKSDSHTEPSGHTSHQRPRIESAHALSTTLKRCFVCNMTDHYTSNCEKFLSLSIVERGNEVKRRGLCFNCLKKHYLKDCSSNSRCKSCHRKHHSLLHREEVKQSEGTSTQVASAATDKGSVLLMTATVLVSGKRNRLSVNVMFDGGSERSYVRSSLLRHAMFTRVGQCELNLLTFGEHENGLRYYDEIELQLFSRHDDASVVIKALSIDKLCAPLQPKLKTSELRRFKPFRNLLLADVFENDEKPIDIIIGTDHMYDIILDERIRTENGPVAENSVFGWVLHGVVDGTLAMRQIQMNLSINHCLPDDEVTLKSFWELEQMGIDQKEICSNAEMNEMVLSEFANTINRRQDGRYEIEWPWVDRSAVQRNDAKQIAFSRLQNLTKRLKTQPETLKEYDQIIKEYVKEGVAKIHDVNFTQSNIDRYLPHHCVIKPTKTTTKLRIVFDAAARDNNGICLNDLMISGPNLNPNMLSVLLRFRSKAVGVVSDIKQAFLQICLKEPEKQASMFLWYDEEVSDNWPQTKPVTFCMNRLLFGVTASPFLLAATIRHHLNSSGLAEKTAKCISDSLYVDDFIFSEDNALDAETIATNTKEILQDMGMELRKWRSNSKEIRQRFEEFQDTVKVNEKVLGVTWNSDTDEIGCELYCDRYKLLPLTKRTILQILASIYDPLGILTPCTITIKCLLQQLWSRKIEWDEEIPQCFEDVCKQWIEEATVLSDLKVPRCVHVSSQNSIQLHGFSDASKTAYAVAIYAKCILPNNSVQTNLLISKAKLAPIKGLSIPRLELLACLLLSRLIKFVIESLSYSGEYFCWTDSCVALFWIQKGVKEWKPFVSNRVKEIRSNIDVSSWRHVKGENNPADLPSRGVRVDKLIASTMWWNGPEFLRMDASYSEYSASDTFLTDTELSSVKEETKKTTTINVAISNEEAVISENRYSGLDKLLRITALVIRFTRNCRKVNQERQLGPITAEEIQAAEFYFCKRAQRQSFSSEIKAINDNQKFDKRSSLKNLNPFLSNGILRIAGRINNSSLSSSAKQPVILPKKNAFTELVVRNDHEASLHAGVGTLVANLRQRYWIIGLRNLIKRVIRNCPICKVHNSRPFDERMAQLPSERVESKMPFVFLHIGIDYAGPLYVIASDTETKKAYILLITCTRSRAVHLELTESLNTADFIRAFQRFIARRGLPRTIFSDNAKTFKRASELLASTYRIKWKFITEAAPWHGGFWERLVRSVKSALKRGLGRHTVDNETMRTLLCRVEAIINSRPLTHIEESNEVVPLCPSHLILGRRIHDNDFDDCAQVPLQESLHQRNEIINSFWSRWELEYLPLLHKVKGQRATDQVQTGDVVLIQTEMKGRHMWPIGRITALHPGPDGRVRTVTLKCSGGKSLRRPIQRLYKLESCNLEATDDSEIEPESTNEVIQNAEVPSDEIQATEDGEESDTDSRNEQFTTDTHNKRLRRTILPPIKYGWS